MSRYRLSPLAESDPDETWLYVAQDTSLAAADRLIDQIVERFELLSRHPGAGRLREDIAPEIRSFPVQNYIIYYTDETDRVLIARVLHGSRDQQSTFDQDR